MFSDVLLRNPIVLNQEQKKKPHNVQIKNNNPKEPKIKQNVKYSAKQSYRRYKSITEPNLHSKIMVDDGDDMVSKIQEAFGIKPKAKPNYTDSITHANPHNKGLDYMPPNGGLDDNSIESIMREVFENMKKKIKGEQMNHEDVAKWGIETMKKHNINEADYERVGEKIHQKTIAEIKRKAELAKDRINKEGSHVLDEFDMDEFGGRYSEHWYDIASTAHQKSQKERETADLFEDVPKNVMEDLINQVIALHPEDPEYQRIDLSQKPMGEREKVEIEIFGDVATPVKKQSTLLLTSPIKGQFLQLLHQQNVARKKAAQDLAGTELSAKTTEVGSIALESAREAAMTKKGRKLSADPEVAARREKRFEDEARRAKKKQQEEEQIEEIKRKRAYGTKFKEAAF